MIGLIKKTFGGDKEFYLEADDSQEAATELEMAPAVVEEKEAEAEVAPKTEAAAEESPAKSEKKKTAKKQQAEVATEAPQTAASTPLDLIVAAVNNTSSTAKTAEASSGESFAAANKLLPTPTSRRRPGPSLNPFKDMARQVRR